jgi:hypothetical protein
MFVPTSIVRSEWGAMAESARTGAPKPQVVIRAVAMALLVAVPLAAQQDPGVANRVRYASLIEQQYLASGTDMHVKADGPQKTTLVLRYTLMSRPLVYQLTHDEDMLLAWHTMQFAWVQFYGYDEIWSYNVATGALRYEKRTP